MAITIISSPNQFQAAYNPIKWVLDSTNKNQPGFRYIVQIYDTGSTASSALLAEMDVAPDPFDNGRCDVDISRIVRNKVDKYLNLSSTTVNDAVGTFYRYDIRFGESFSGEWAFNDYVFVAGDTGLTTDTTYGGGFSNVTHPYQVGDQVYVELNTTYNDCRDVINGYFTVTEVVSDKTIKINLTFPCSNPASPGKVRYADNRKVRTYNLASQTQRLVLNAAQDIIEYSGVTGSMAAYEITTSSSAKLLTNVPSGFKVSPTQHMWLNQFVNTSGTTDSINIRFVNSNGDIFNKSNSGNFYVKQNSIGPGNLGTLSVVSGSAPLIKSDTEWYDVYITDDDGDTVTEIKRFYIDRRCPINDIEVVFMDRKGSFMSFYFPLKKFERITTEKEMYNKYVKTFTTSADGVQVYNSDYKKTLTLNTNYMTDDMNLYFEELLTSPYTYVRLEGYWYSCKVMAGNFETERTRNKRLIKRSIDIEFDMNTPVNI
jgi:hypothetical protein